MIWSGEYFKCRACGEIYPYRTPQCPCCGGICDRIGSFVREDFSDWSANVGGDAPSQQGGVPKPLGRVARWAQKLLDLTLGNRLLNLKDSKKVIPLLCPNIGALEDKIASDETVGVQSLSALLGQEKYQDYIHGRLNYNPADFNVTLEKELEKKRLWTRLTPVETQRRLKELYRLAKLDLEESGVNTLFLALGFLEWKIDENDEHLYRSPILLVPVRLERRSISDGIRMARLDDDTVLNATLLELLRCQFGIGVAGVDPLPIDASGVDVSQIMDRFRDAIQGKQGWSVVEEALIGQFSFGKFVMWKDMTARIGDFKKNKLVSHLIDGGGFYEDGVEVFPPNEISRYIDCNSLYCPMSADSSQLTAVLYSAMGKSFVLHGPPGTGKSQTITNIIAHNMALGRKVLFVSEKKAALDVVHRRLSSIGLGPFCLELHSNKAGKADVLAQFSAALKVGDLSEPADWAATVTRLEGLRQDLNGYVIALHTTYPNGMSAYDCLATLLNRGTSQFARCIGIQCTRQSVDDYNATLQCVADLGAAAALVDMTAYRKLAILKDLVWSPSIELELQDCVSSTLAVTIQMEAIFDRTAALLSLDGSDTRFGIIDRVRKVLQTLFSAGSTPVELITDEIEASGEFLLQFKEIYHRREATGKKLESFKLDDVLNLDVKGIARRIEENNRAFFLVKFIRNFVLVKELASVKKIGGGKFTFQELQFFLPSFEEYQKAEAEYRRSEDKARSLLGELWNAGLPDWEAISTALENSRNCVSAVNEAVVEDHPHLLSALDKIRAIMGNAKHELSQGSELSKLKEEYVSTWTEFRQWVDALGQYADFDLSNYDFPTFKAMLEGIAASVGEMRNVFRYRDVRQNTANHGVEGFAVDLERQMLDTGSLNEEFKFAYATKMLNEVFSNEPSLSSFSGIGHEERIKKFQEIDKEYTKLSARMVFAKVAAGLPRRRSGSALAKTTPLGLLRHECEKKARHMPVRQLLSEIGSLAGMLKPCFLMSPLSVAQYLPADTDQFDLIVFDEASQIPVWDAIGVIARADQVIIVGDPKQMPPTNFFQKGDADANYDTDGVEDLESILDECLAAGVYSAYLGWHYRSRHESLISFSNHNYYEDKLLTFPSASESPRLGVRFMFVPNGIYDRKASRTNRNEAVALVDYIFNTFKDPAQRGRSMGVVTFSEAQKKLIEDIVDKRREKEPAFERFFSDQNDEPFFVKNLENVQGDERDVILFSICYASDAEGKFSMNFGPLNKVGGERRLNVAVTRAKEQVVLFSSIHAHQIDLDRTDSVGVAHLKDFIDFAEKGFAAITDASTAETGNDELEATVAAFLAEKGYKVERSVGRSDCKIDIAVRNPQDESQYLLGIECDGRTYAHSATARDRDALLPSVLKSLGWRISSVWSVDWMFDRQHAEQRLLDALEEAKTAPVEPPPPPEASSPMDFQSEAEELARPEDLYEKYRIWRTNSIFLHGYFTDSRTRPKIIDQIHAIVSVEAPICESLLYKRIARAWNIRLTDNYRKVIAMCLDMSGIAKTSSGAESVYWTNEQTPESYDGFRVPDAYDSDTKRAINEIPSEEIANAMLCIATDLGGCDKEAVYKETMKLFGLGGVTAKARISLDCAMDILERKGTVA